MLEKIRGLAAAYREQLSYLVVGCLTTLINYAVYAVFTYGLHVHYIAGNVIAWVVAVAFAYFANGRWVYRSTARRGWKEAFSFVLSRLFSRGLETLLLLVRVDRLQIDELAAKIPVAVLVVVVNYLTGLLVFKRKERA